MIVIGGWGDREAARTSFAKTGLAVLRGLVSHEAARALREGVLARWPAAMRKDFRMPQSGMTPRRMSVVGGCVMNGWPEVTALYGDAALRAELSAIVGSGIADCPELVENVIATILHEPGDTHGWHTDDYPVALVICLEAPPCGKGGLVELARGPEIEEVRLAAGDAYVLRSDRVRHRVAPMTGAGRRIILNFTYAFPGCAVTPNGSAQLLCAERAASARPAGPSPQCR